MHLTVRHQVLLKSKLLGYNIPLLFLSKMNPDIQVIDNFVSDNALEELTQFFTHQCDWRWTDSCVYIK